MIASLGVTFLLGETVEADAGSVVGNVRSRGPACLRDQVGQSWW